MSGLHLIHGREWRFIFFQIKDLHDPIQEVEKFASHKRCLKNAPEYTGWTCMLEWMTTATVCGLRLVQLREDENEFKMNLRALLKSGGVRRSNLHNNYKCLNKLKQQNNNKKIIENRIVTYSKDINYTDSFPNTTSNSSMQSEKWCCMKNLLSGIRTINPLEEC